MGENELGVLERVETRTAIIMKKESKAMVVKSWVLKTGLKRKSGGAVFFVV